jgi:hypothetical protein
VTAQEVAVIALLAIIIAVIWGKDVKAAFNFLGLGSFTLEATDPTRRSSPRPRKARDRELPES